MECNKKPDTFSAVILGTEDKALRDSNPEQITSLSLRGQLRAEIPRSLGNHLTKQLPDPFIKRLIFLTCGTLKKLRDPSTEMELPETSQQRRTKTVRQTPLTLSSQAGRHRSASLLIPREHYCGYKDRNELAAVGPWSTSSGIHSTKFLGLVSQIAPRSPSIKSLDATVIKQCPRPEK